MTRYWKFSKQSTTFSLAFILILLVGRHLIFENKTTEVWRSTELGSISPTQTPSTELDIKLVDPAMSEMWGLQSMKAQLAWDKLKATGSREIKVAIIDTGVDKNHPDLQHNLWVNQGEVGIDTEGRNKSINGKDDDENGCVDDVHGCNFTTMTGDITDDHGHGTHIAGIIGATRGNGVGVSGVAPNVSLMILKYYDPKTHGFNNLSNTVKAIYYAIQAGAHIINYSGGGVNPSPLEKRAIELANKKGILFVAAAGNERSNLDLEASYFPADYPLSGIISVTAFDKSRNVLPTSNYGASSVDVAAPGNNILSTLPGGKYGHMTGTSQATAFVTGVAALIMSKFRDFNAQKIIKHLTVTGDLDVNLKGKTIYRKRLNTYRALAMLDQGVSATGTIANNVSHQGIIFSIKHNTQPSSSLKQIQDISMALQEKKDKKK